MLKFNLTFINVSNEFIQFGVCFLNISFEEVEIDAGTNVKHYKD